MVAGLLRILGVNMGDNIDPTNHEDLDLQHRHPIHMRELIREKNERYDEWGWKDPLVVDHIEDLFDLCDIRYPVVFVVFRDIVATAESLVAYEGWSFEYALNHVHRQNIKLMDFMKNHIDEFSIHPLSYEKMMAHKGDMVKFFAGQVDVELDDDILNRGVRFMTPGYKEIGLVSERPPKASLNP